MAALALLLGIALVAMALIAVDARRRLNGLTRVLEDSFEILFAGGAPIAAMQKFRRWELWLVVQMGGDHRWGFWDARGDCPGQRTYFIDSDEHRFPREPTNEQIADAYAFPPPPRSQALSGPCPGNCVNSLTNVWYSWALCRNQLTGEFRLRVYTHAQYECKRPDDPALGDPVEAGHPRGGYPYPE